MKRIFVAAACCWLAACVATGERPGAAADQAAPSPSSVELAQRCMNGPERRPNYGRAAANQMIQMGWSRVEAKDGPAALELFWGALNAGPERPDAYWGMAVAGHLARLDAAAVDACFAKTQALLPDVPGAFADHGRVLAIRGDHQAAIEKLRRALAIDPDFAEAHIGMAVALTALGDEAAAQRHIDRAQALTGK